MFASTEFFIALIGSSLVLNFAVGRFFSLSMKRYFLAIAAFAMGYLIFHSYAVLGLVLWFYLITRLKWGGFFIQTATALFCLLFPLILVKFGALSPLAIVGLSFMTFRAVDAILTMKEKPAFVDYFSYLVLPFVVITGPMYRYKQFQKDVEHNFLNPNSVDYEKAIELIVLGVLQKFLFATLIYNRLLSPLDINDFSIVNVMLSAVYYSVFLYFDFAGYSNMAIGCGKLFGFNLPANFNLPIFAKNPQDFWRRWHISLSDWLRDMIFMPLYMHLLRFDFFKSHKLLAQNLGIFSTLFVMGIWNGPHIRYIVSGTLFGLYSVGHNCLVNYAKQNNKLKQIMDIFAVGILGRVVTLMLAALSLYVFSGRSFLG